MEKTTFEFVEFEEDLPVKVLYFSQDSPFFSREMKAISRQEDIMQFVPIHWHEELEITYVVKGKLSLRKNNETKEYQDGDFFIINSGEVHELSGKLDGDFTIICFIISYDFVKTHLPNIDQLHFDLDNTRETYPELEKLFLSILASEQGSQPFSNLKMTSDLLQLFYLLCNYHLKMDMEENLKKDSFNQQNRQILDYIHRHYKEQLSLGDVASHFNFSKEHFARLFKENFKRTFLTYLIDYRLYRAFPEIVKGNQTIEWISQKHGFPSSKALIKHFKKVYQETPIQYRKKYIIQINDHNDT